MDEGMGKYVSKMASQQQKHHNGAGCCLSLLEKMGFQPSPAPAERVQ